MFGFICSMLYYFFSGVIQLIFVIVPTILGHIIYIGLILFGLALFTVPSSDSFIEWMKSHIGDNEGPVPWNNHWLIRIAGRYILPNIIDITTDIRYHNFGCCRLATCQFPNQPQRNQFLGIFNTWIPLN